MPDSQHVPSHSVHFAITGETVPMYHTEPATCEDCGEPTGSKAKFRCLGCATALAQSLGLAPKSKEVTQ